MSIASELQNYADGLDDAYDAVSDMSGIIPQDKNMNNLDAAIRTIPVGATPNDGVLTIQQNGTTLGTFSANQSTNTTVNVTTGGGAAVVDYFINDTMGNLTPLDNFTIYKDAACTIAATQSEFWNDVQNKQVRLVCDGALMQSSSWVAYYVYFDNENADVYENIEEPFFQAIDYGHSRNYGFEWSSGPGPLLYGSVEYQPKLTAGLNISISNNTISATDTTYSDFTGATSSVAGTNGLVPAPSAGDQGKVLHGDGTWKDATAKLVEMSYGESNAWAKFIAAYNAGSIVYCRASSNANPGSGSQTRKAFMAYVNNATSPTSVEFQYVRSNSSKTDSQQCDQVFVYTLTNASGGTWSVASRNMAPKINVSGAITKTFSNGANATVTIGADAMTGATSGAAGTAGIVPAPAAGDDTKFLKGDGTWATVSGGGPTVVQTTGQSTTDVMSQKAVTDLVGNVETVLQTLISGNGAQ